MSGTEVEAFVDQTDPGIVVFGKKLFRRDVLRFCLHMLPNTTCRACDLGEYGIWLYSPSTDRITVATSVKIHLDANSQEKFELNTDLFMPVFYVVCDRCGHTRNHTIAAAINWLEANPEAPQ